MTVAEGRGRSRHLIVTALIIVAAGSDHSLHQVTEVVAEVVIKDRSLLQVTVVVEEGRMDHLLLQAEEQEEVVVATNEDAIRDSGGPYLLRLR